MSSWKTRFHPEALKEVEKMDGQIKSLAKSKLKQISANPFLGIALGNKHGIDLTGYYKAYFFKKKFRIVYSIDSNSRTIFVVSINKREDLLAYNNAFKPRQKRD